MPNIDSLDALTILARKNAKLSVKEEKDYKENYYPYGMVSPIRRKQNRKVYMDILDLLTKVSKSAFVLFNEIKLQSDKDTGIAVMNIFEDYNKAKMSSIYRRLVELQKIGLIKKVTQLKDLSTEIAGMNTVLKPEKYSYMINPYHIKPWKINLANEIWDKL